MSNLCRAGPDDWHRQSVHKRAGCCDWLDGGNVEASVLQPKSDLVRERSTSQPRALSLCCVFCLCAFRPWTQQRTWATLEAHYICHSVHLSIHTRHIQALVEPIMHRPWAAHVDLYRKVPADLMEGTRRGSVLSYCSLVLMGILFLLETKAFFSTR